MLFRHWLEGKFQAFCYARLPADHSPMNSLAYYLANKKKRICVLDLPKPGGHFNDFLTAGPGNQYLMKGLIFH